MRVVFLNRFYWPEEPATAQLLTDLAETLAGAGHDVLVITSHPGAAQFPPLQSQRGVTILRIASTRWTRFRLVGKAANFTTFYFGALWKLIFTLERNDRVVALTDPPLIGIGAWIAARLCGARIYHWVQDIYPEIATVVTGQPWLCVVTPLRNLAWRRSDGCITLGSDMASTLERAGVAPERITLSSNWAPAGLGVQPVAALSHLRTAWKLEDKFVVAYSGNLGRVHDLDPVLDVAAALRDESEIAFVFIGSGAQRARLESAAAKRGLHNVHFHPSQPRARLAESLAVADLHLVTLLPGCEWLVFPSKLYGIAAVGRPVIFIGPRKSEVARIVSERGLGRAFSREEVAAIAAGIRDLRADTARLNQLRSASAAFGREHSGPTPAAATWETLLGDPI